MSTSNEVSSLETKKIDGTSLLSAPISTQLAYLPQVMERCSPVLKLDKFAPPFYSQSSLSNEMGSGNACFAASVLNALYAAGIDEFPKGARPDELASRLQALWASFCNEYSRPYTDPLGKHLPSMEVIQKTGASTEKDLFMYYFQDKTREWFGYKKTSSPLEIAYSLLRGSAAVAASTRAAHTVAMVEVDEKFPFFVSFIDPLPTIPAIGKMVDGLQQQFTPDGFALAAVSSDDTRLISDIYLVDRYKKDKNYPWVQFKGWMTMQEFKYQPSYIYREPPPTLEISLK